jgi:hypothetical protein
MQTSTTIARWSKAALARHRAEQSRGILQPLEAIKTLAQYHVRGASFQPTELKLEAGLPEAEWMKIARAVAHVRECAHFWLGDLMLYGVRLYGVQTAYDLARQATSLPESTLRNAYWCSKKYRPDQRKPELSYCHHLRVARYPDETREKILTEAAELGLTSRQCLEMAQAEHGKLEKPKGARVDLKIHLWPETVERLKTMADGKQLNWFISRAIEDWLRWKGEGDCIPHPQTTAERRAEWEAEGLCILCGTRPHLEGRKICEHCRQTRNLMDKIAANRPGSGRWRRRHAHTSAVVAASAN